MNTKHCKKCGETQPTSNFSKCKANKDGLQAKCKACQSAAATSWYARNAEKNIAYSREWQVANKERVSQNVKRYRSENAEKIAAGKRQWAADNRSRVRATCRQYEAAKIKRTPAWLSADDKRAIVDVYSSADANAHVDHVIPLQGELVSGLHVPSNLQVIPAKQNLSKSNHFDPNTHEEPIWHHS